MKVSTNALTLISIAAGIGLACQTTEQTGSSDEPATAAASQPASQSFEIDRLKDATRDFTAGNGKGFASHYAPDGLLVLSSGVTIRGAALDPAASESGPTVKEWSISSPKIHRNDEGSYVVGSSRTVIQPPQSDTITIDGTRLVAWNGAGKDAAIQVDFNIAGKPTSVPAELTIRLESLEAAWNAHDISATRSHFTDDAVYVLSDSRVFIGDDLDGLFGFAFKAGFSDMTYSPKGAWKAGESWYVASDFSFAMEPEGERVEVAGCQVDLWTQADGEWRIAAEVAQPSASKACL
jgi:ketosteroid isomerase-like protein